MPPDEPNTLHAYAIPEPALMAWTRASEGAEERAKAAEAASLAAVNRLALLEGNIRPMLEEYAAELAARRTERANTVAGRLEGRSGLEVFLTSKPAMAFYGALLMALTALTVRCSGVDDGNLPVLPVKLQKAQEAPQPAVGDPNG